VKWPPLSEQRTITHILGALDDKIELNRRMNETLEAMARAIFKSWFVDFDPVRAKAEGRRPPGMDAETAALFPDTFVNSPMGKIPEGWNAGTIADIAKNPRRGIEPSSVTPDTPYIGLEHMPRHSIALGEWGSAGTVESNKFSFGCGEILFGKLRPYFHKVGVAPIDGVCSTDILVLLPTEPEWFGIVLGHVSSDEFVAHADATSSGTKMPRTNWKDLARFNAALPPKSLSAAFTKCTRSIAEKVIANIHESRALAALRDALLPKLLSGEISAKTSIVA
jgi:type I restriction enzyme S subunit